MVRFKRRVKFLLDSFIEYLGDVATWRVDAFSFKTAEFCKRNFNKVRSALSHIMYELRKVKQGFGRLKNDVLYYFGVQRKQFDKKYT